MIRRYLNVSIVKLADQISSNWYTYTPFGTLALIHVEVYSGQLRPERENIPEV
jgi:hypothetical protein